MHATGNRAPAHFVAKAPYLLQDLQRQSAYFGTPLCIPETFPANTITAMRLLTVVKQKSPQALESLSRALWQLHYGEGQDITTEPNLLLAATRAGLTANAAIQFLQQTQDADIKETLKTVTAKAVEMGAFGAPTFFIETPQGNEMFFGSDRFHLVASMLGKQWLGPLP
jgi:glutathione S-transferase kappa 1